MAELDLDRLSALPDAILLQIIAFNDIKDAARTSTLSKRWKFLWTNISEIILSQEASEEAQEDELHFVNRVDKIILMCRGSGSNINKFDISFSYDESFLSNVNSWIDFAVQKKVKDIRLDMMNDDYQLPEVLYSFSYLTSLTAVNCDVAPSEEVIVTWQSLKKLSIEFGYVSNFEKVLSGCSSLEILKLYRHLNDDFELPPNFYSLSTVTNMLLHGCDVDDEAEVIWESLKTLSLEQMELSQVVMTRLLSGCPVLEVLHLQKCTLEFLSLEIKSQSLTSVTIENCIIGPEILEISTPNVLYLSIYASQGECRYKLIDTSQVVQASFCFDGETIWYNVNPSHQMDHMERSLESLKSVKKLELGPWNIEVLSLLELNGRRLPPFTLSCLTLEVWRSNKSIPGIIGILHSSPNIETLTIEGLELPYERIEPEDKLDLYIQKANLDLVALSTLRTAKILLFTDGEPMSTIVQLILKWAPALERMVINSTNLSAASQVRVLSFPRASHNVRIVFE